MDLYTTPAYHTSNSYCDLQQAEAYLTAESRVASSDPWNTITDAKKKFVLFIAAKALNTFNYKGLPVTESQKLAFPRFTWRQVNKEKRTPYKDFFDATLDVELDSIVSNADIAVSNNKLVDQTSSADAFYSDHYLGYLNNNQLIKVVGLSTDTYLTIKDIPADGSYLEIKETISDEASPSGGVDIYATPLFGFPDEVMWAQIELAYQAVQDITFVTELNKTPEPTVKSWSMGGTISVSYMNKFLGNSKFNKNNSNSLDIIYYLLGDWISSTGGRIV